MRGQESKVLAKDEDDETILLLLIYFWLNMTERLSWGKELLLTADNIATPNLHTDLKFVKIFTRPNFRV